MNTEMVSTLQGRDVLLKLAQLLDIENAHVEDSTAHAGRAFVVYDRSGRRRGCHRTQVLKFNGNVFATILTFPEGDLIPEPFANGRCTFFVAGCHVKALGAENEIAAAQQIMAADTLEDLGDFGAALFSTFVEFLVDSA